MTPPAHYPEILIDLAQLIEARIQSYMDAAVAEQLVLDIAEDIRLKFGGGLIYIPKGSDFERRRRDGAIWRDFNGRNHAELAHKHGLGVAAVYDIIARERLRRQRDLFN